MEEITLCTLCEKPTPMLSTKLCNSCWELSSKIENNPILAKKILTQLNKWLPMPDKPGYYWFRHKTIKMSPSIIYLKEGDIPIEGYEWLKIEPPQE